MYEDFVRFARNWYQTEAFIPLHAPVFTGNEKQYVCDAIDSTFVSSVSNYVDRFEEQLCVITGAKHAVSVTNGTAAIHLALHALGVGPEAEVITQSLTFVATCNAIVYAGAHPVFVDVDADTMAMSPESLAAYLEQHARIVDGQTINQQTGRSIGACLPMHTFGHPARIREIIGICDDWNIPVVEDAAESLGSQLDQRHCGRFGKVGALSFNGNKIVTSGGGGAILTDDEDMATRLKFLSTTAKQKHRWNFRHEELGFNYRMPGLNAALGCAQLERLGEFIDDKRALGRAYQTFFEAQPERPFRFVTERSGSRANYWLHTLVFDDQEAQQAFLTYTNDHGVMTRPAWDPMHFHARFEQGASMPLTVSESLYTRAVNLPSSPRSPRSITSEGPVA